MSVNTVKNDGSLLRVAGGTLYADAPIGEIHAFGGSVIPSGYLLCDGQAVSRTTYAELFAVIGTTFGTGNGSTTFNVPDLREAVPVGTGVRSGDIEDHDTYTLGQFKDDQLQEHGHTFKQEGGVPPSGNIPSNSNVLLGGSQTSALYNTEAIQSTSVTDARTGTTTHGKQLGVNYIIKAKQVAVPFDVAEYVRNQNVLSDVETVTLPMTVPYDGELIPVASNGGYVTFSINGSEYTVGSLTGMTSSSGLPIKKGDGLTLQALVGTAGFTARYYKLRDYTGR